MITFDADEVFEMAEQIERNGGKFYRKVAQTCADVRTRDALLALAAMEDEHRKRFAALRAQQARHKTSSVFDPEGEAALYLRAMADGHVFDPGGDPSERLTGAESSRDVLTTAIGLEKDSIVFYLGLRDLVPADAGKSDIESIIREEMGHITTLSKRLRELEGAAPTAGA